MTIPFKTPPIDYFQHQLFPTNVFDLLAADHECFLYHDLFEQLDTSSLEANYSPLGQHAYHPEENCLHTDLQLQSRRIQFT